MSPRSVLNKVLYNKQQELLQVPRGSRGPLQEECLALEAEIAASLERDQKGPTSRGHQETQAEHCEESHNEGLAEAACGKAGGALLSSLVDRPGRLPSWGLTRKPSWDSIPPSAAISFRVELARNLDKFSLRSWENVTVTLSNSLQVLKTIPGAWSLANPNPDPNCR